MKRGKITDALRGGRVLISDGAWGTYLQKLGLKPGECPELWCVDRFDDIKNIAKNYMDAGSDMVGTNSFARTASSWITTVYLAGYPK